MLATASAPPPGTDFGYETRWEGLRLLAGLEGERLCLRTGAGQDPACWFPELSALRAAAQPEWVLFDGELVALRDGHVSPALLQKRLRGPQVSAPGCLADDIPLTLMLYDVLRIGDSWLLDVTWEERRDILRRVLMVNQVVQRSPAHRTITPAIARARGLGLATVMAKRLRGRYCPGERTRDWLAVKAAGEPARRADPTLAES